MRLKLVPDETNFDFFKRETITLGLSALLVIASIVIYFVDGLNYGIDFRGGTMIMAQTVEAEDTGAFRETLAGLGLGDTSVTEVTDPAAELAGTAKHVVMMRIEASGDDEIQADAIASVKEALSARFAGITFLSVESVGAKVSGELIQAGILAVLLSVAAVLFYIWLRFEWQFSVAAVIALVHDVALTIGVFSLFNIEFNLSIIAALLTIIGYSLNDTVVVFDRVRENLRKFKTTPLVEVLNASINQTLSRTLMTSGTTLIALIALFLLGGDVIRGFTFAMIWGVLVGTYSSVFVAAAIVLRLGVKRDWDKKNLSAGTRYANIDA